MLIVFGDLCWLLRDLRLLAGLFVIVWWFLVHVLWFGFGGMWASGLRVLRFLVVWWPAVWVPVQCGLSDF